MGTIALWVVLCLNGAALLAFLAALNAGPDGDTRDY